MSYSERHLPHWIPEQAAIFVTWRLAGTWREPDSACWLAEPAIARITADALRYGDAVKHWYRLHAWVVMPNHVHVVMTPEHAFPEIMRWLKWTTARRSNQLLRRTGTAFWQQESYDHSRPVRTARYSRRASSSGLLVSTRK